jgi:hypothetical protein
VDKGPLVSSAGEGKKECDEKIGKCINRSRDVPLCESVFDVSSLGRCADCIFAIARTDLFILLKYIAYALSYASSLEFIFIE